MKIKLIKPITKIRMKLNNFTCYIPLLANRYPLTANSCPLSITSASGGSGNRLSRGLLIMQNEPNFRTSPMLLTTVTAATYNEKPLVNPKITNPIEPNTNPIAKRPKINANFCYDRELQ